MVKSVRESGKVNDQARRHGGAEMYYETKTKELRKIWDEKPFMYF